MHWQVSGSTATSDRSRTGACSSASADTLTDMPLAGAMRSARLPCGEEETMTVTVVIPTKDRPHLLGLTVASALGQRGVSTKVIVVDDGGREGSTDDVTRAWPAVRVVRHETSQGVAAARNAGLELVDTEWVAFLDDDDLWSPDKLSNQLRRLEADRTCQWACSAAASFTAPSNVYGVQRPPLERDLSRALLRLNVVPGGGSGVLVRTSLMQHIDGFDAAFSTLADWEAWLRLAQVSPVACVRDADVGYRTHHTSMSQGPRTWDEIGRLQAKHALSYRQLGQDLDTEAVHAWLRIVSYRAGDWSGIGSNTLDLLRLHGPRSAFVTPGVQLLQRHLGATKRQWGVDRATRQDLRYARTWLQAHVEAHAGSHVSGR
jgi:GT2 family glycosyltransferase